MLSALIITAISIAPREISPLLKEVVKWHVSYRWYAFVLLVPPALMLIAAGINHIFFQEFPDLTQYGRLNDLFPAFNPILAIIAHFLIVGVGEEVGWRGFALPRLQTRCAAMKAVLILGPLWGFWHLPTFMIDNSPLTSLGTAVFFSIASIPISVVYSWLFNSTRGSLFIVSLWSTSTTLAFGSQAAIGIIPVIMYVGLMFIAMIIANRRGTEDLASKPKLTLDTYPD